MTAFHRVTGLAAKLIPAEIPLRVIRFGAQENDFCREMICRQECRCACYRIQTMLLHRLEHKLKPQQACCMGGMLHLALPVVAGGRHAATIVGGGVRMDFNGPSPVKELMRNCRRRQGANGWQRLQGAYGRLPVFTPERVGDAVRLLDVLARLFAEVIPPPPPPNCSSPRIAEVKQFVELHLADHLTTRETAAALHLSTAYFCRLFHRWTGTTFHSYLARVRTEAAKAALRSNGRSITDIAMDAGFQSISDFNRVFKATVGMSPSLYRRAQHVN